jgi:hypothetical protein
MSDKLPSSLWGSENAGQIWDVMMEMAGFTHWGIFS